MSVTKLNPSLSAAKSLFLGNIAEENLFPFPQISGAEAETIKMVLESVDKFMSGKEKQFRDYDHKGAQPDPYLQQLRELGLFGLIIPEEFGGIGLSNTGYSRVLQQTSRFDASTSLTIGAHSSIGMKGLLLFGNEEQKTRYLPRLASGEMIAAFCLTEPGSGSDAASIKTTARKNSDGSWTLNGDKIWITNGPIADFFTVFAKTEGAEGKLTAFIVERGYSGLSTGPKEDKLGIRASATSTVTFQNVQVPGANVLGEEGKGFKVAMSILNSGRTGLGGGCVGGIKRLIALATEQAGNRKQFGKPIAEFGLVQEKIAQMVINCFATESVVAMVGHYIDSGVEDYSTEAAISKIFATESMWSAVNEALQIAGGNGFMKEYPYELVMRDSRINMIFEGTSEILRLYIGLSGLKEAGEYLKEIKKSVGTIFNEPIKGFGILSRFASKKVSQLTTLGHDKVEEVPECLRQEAAIFEQHTLRLSKAADALLMKFGKKIVDQQFHTKRVADIAIDLFVGLCTLSRVSKLIAEKGEKECREECDIMHAFAKQAKRRMGYNLQRLVSNEDEHIERLAKGASERKGYRWDILP